ncbi:MAG TPA: isoprenylcysteine carboxylmethyltransferase family protein, partial [Blastocatellia bacterium]|nr:isoprenylcysteine carboxylmethyltransferase family protein [Blastocatellia bacterium]
MTRWSLLPGVIITSAGLWLRLWAEGWLVKNDVLSTRGPYLYTRNPLYLGTGLMILGQSLMSGVPWALLVFPVLWMILYWPTMQQEEAHLSACHGAEYAAYREHVPRLLPRLWPVRDQAAQLSAGTNHSGEAKFSWPRVFRYRW